MLLSLPLPPTNIFCLHPPHPISRYFCKESLVTPPPPPPQHTSPLQASLLLLLPLQKFSSYYFLHFVFIRFPFVFTRVHSCSIRIHSRSFVFIRVHSCSLVFHSCSLVFHLCSLVFIRVPLVFIRVPLVFIRVPLVFTRVHSCSDLCGVLDMILVLQVIGSI